MTVREDAVVGARPVARTPRASAARRPSAISLAERIERTREACVAALAADDVARAEQFLERRGLGARERLALLGQGARRQGATPELRAMRDALAASGGPAADSGAFERALLLRASLGALDRLDAVPVDDSVKHLFCKEFAYYAAPPDSARRAFSLDESVYFVMAKIARFERFPAGGSQWEVSGFPRRWLLRVTPRFMAATLYFLARESRGFAPFFVGHLSGTRFRLPCIIEREFRVAFYRSALALERQPEVRGIMAGSWLHSRETHRVSPYLAFLNRPYLEAGGLYTEIGPAHPSDGFLEGSKERTELYEAGEYKPTFGVVMCTRDQVIAWARAHPEIETQLAVR